MARLFVSATVVLSGSLATAGTDAHSSCIASESFQDATSLMQMNLQIDAPRARPEKLKDYELSQVQNGKEGILNWQSLGSLQPWSNETRCLPFETSTASNGLPVCVEALLFGLFSAFSLPIGAALGAALHPISAGVTARWMALGAGALVFSVATQIYGNSLFALLAVSRKYGPFDAGCKEEKGVSVCDEKFWNMMVQLICGLIGAGVYVLLSRWLEIWSANNSKSFRVCNSIGAERAEKEKSLPFVERVRKAQKELDNEEQERRDEADAAFEQLNGPDSGRSGYSDAGTAQNHSGLNSQVALAMWLGCLLDSFPEAIMLGLMTNRHQVSFGFLFSLFLANFPEAFSGGSILLSNRMSSMTMILLWSSIFMLTGFVSLCSSYIFPEACAGDMFSKAALYGTAMAQGLTGGAMLAMLATAMLPAAYKGARYVAGIYFVLGFIIATFIEVLNSYLASPQMLMN